MTTVAVSQCTEETARALTDRLRASLVETNRLAAQLPRTASRRATSVYFVQMTR